MMDSPQHNEITMPYTYPSDYDSQQGPEKEGGMNDDLREEFILQAQRVFDCILEVYPDTQMRMTDSDHGYEEWLIAPLTVAIGNEKAILSVEDAGESQRRLVLLVLDDEPFIKVHSYFTPEGETP